MREIKFRVWDKENNQFFRPTYEAYRGELEDITITLNGTLMLRDMNRNAVDQSLFPDRFEPIQQYTGLKDKNGKEIYEGDVYHMGDPNITYTVVWSDTGLKGKQNGSSSFAGLSSWQERIEVVGNIYD